MPDRTLIGQYFLSLRPAKAQLDLYLSGRLNADLFYSLMEHLVQCGSTLLGSTVLLRN